MPNWVQNRLTIYGQETEIEKCLLFCKSEESDFDFNKIVSMPETLDISEGRDSVQAAAYVYSLLSEKKAERNIRCAKDNNDNGSSVLSTC